MEFNEKELHHLGMNHIGEILQEMGYEFLSINSELKKNPQFIAHKIGEKNIFVWVKTTTYPQNPNEVDSILLKKLQLHAKEKKALLWYAGVGIANEKDLELKPTKEANYLIKFDGFKNFVT